MLSRPDQPLPAGAEVVDLAPLPPSAVRELVSSYIGPEDLDAATARRLAGVGWLAGRGARRGAGLAPAGRGGGRAVGGGARPGRPAPTWWRHVTS